MYLCQECLEYRYPDNYYREQDSWLSKGCEDCGMPKLCFDPENQDEDYFQGEWQQVAQFLPNNISTYRAISYPTATTSYTTPQFWIWNDPQSTAN